MAINGICFAVEPQSRFREVQRFYESVAYLDEISPNCTVITASANGIIIGAARLAPEYGVLVLRGMNITPEYQRRGIGTCMLFALQEHMGHRACYCLPHSWLKEFYEKIGFQVIETHSAPEFLQDRLKDANERGLDLITMMRSIQL